MGDPSRLEPELLASVYTVSISPLWHSLHGHLHSALYACVREFHAYILSIDYPHLYSHWLCPCRMQYELSHFSLLGLHERLSLFHYSCCTLPIWLSLKDEPQRTLSEWAELFVMTAMWECHLESTQKQTYCCLGQIATCLFPLSWIGKSGRQEVIG